MLRIQRLNACIFILTIFIGHEAFAQTTNVASKENKLTALYSKLNSFTKQDYDSISLYSDKFEAELTHFIKSTPASLDYPFKKLVNSHSCYVITSSDKKFRTYSWDTQEGGTMHIYRTIYQWRSNGKVFTEVPDFKKTRAGSFCSKIFTVHIAGKPCYLAVTNATFSTKDAMQSISAFTIEGNKLVDTVKLFKTKSKKLNRIDVGFDFLSVVDRPERPLELITFDDKQKTIYVPVVDHKGQVTDKHILYQLQGPYFEFSGIQ